MTSLGELSNRLRRVHLEAVQRRALEDAAQRIEEAVRTALSHSPGGEHDAPWLQSGELRDSIEHEADATRAVIGSTSEIAAYQELGTRTVPPRPVLGPVAAALGQSVAEVIGAAVADAIRTAAAGRASANPQRYGAPETLQEDNGFHAELIDWTADIDYACKALGLDRREASKVLHALKGHARLGGANNVLIEIPSGDVYYGDECIGNLRD